MTKKNGPKKSQSFAQVGLRTNLGSDGLRVPLPGGKSTDSTVAAKINSKKSTDSTKIFAGSAGGSSSEPIRSTSSRAVADFHPKPRLEIIQKLGSNSGYSPESGEEFEDDLQEDRDHSKEEDLQSSDEERN